MIRPLLLILALLLLASCSKESALHFQNLKREAMERQRHSEEVVTGRRMKEAEKKRVWLEIVTEARESFKEIEPIIQNKCFACHDSNTKLPVYGRIFRNHNPVNSHRLDGIRTLDFSTRFPLSAQGNPPQISLLKTIRAVVLDRTMPLKFYRTVFPSKKITMDDEQLILAWIDPLMAKLEEFDLTYVSRNGGVAAESKRILEQKCFRCHANGNDRGQFGGMEDTALLVKNKFIIPKDPENSKLYKIIVKGKMPPDPRQAMTSDELSVVRDWIDSISTSQ